MLRKWGLPSFLLFFLVKRNYIWIISMNKRWLYSLNSELKSLRTDWSLTKKVSSKKIIIFSPNLNKPITIGCLKNLDYRSKQMLCSGQAWSPPLQSNMVYCKLRLIYTKSFVLLNYITIYETINCMILIIRYPLSSSEEHLHGKCLLSLLSPKLKIKWNEPNSSCLKQNKNFHLSDCYFLMILTKHKQNKTCLLDFWQDWKE